MRINERLLISSAYLFGIPALYIVLTSARKSGDVGRHGAQAFGLWVLFFAIFFGIRYLIDFVWAKNFAPGLEKLEIFTVVMMGSYALFRAYRGFTGK